MIDLLGAIQRAALQAGVLLLIGAAVWKLWISPRAFTLAVRGGGVDGEVGEESSFIVARVGRFAALALIPVWLLRFYLQVLGFRDPFAPLSEDILFLLRYTIFGPVWIVQGITILLVAGALVRLGRTRAGAWSRPRGEPGEAKAGRGRVEWILVIVGAGVLALTLALSSHGLSAEGSPALAVTADLLHTLAAGAWLGTLVLVLTTQTRTSRGSDAYFGAQLRAFSPIAIGAVTVLIAMGVFLGWQYLGTPSNLWSSTYGRILSAKVAVAGVVMLMGLLNWRRGMPAIDAVEMRAVVWKRARWELMIAVIVLLLTGVLTGAPRPPAPEGAEEITAAEPGVDVAHADLSASP